MPETKTPETKTPETKTPETKTPDAGMYALTDQRRSPVGSGRAARSTDVVDSAGSVDLGSGVPSLIWQAPVADKQLIRTAFVILIPSSAIVYAAFGRGSKLCGRRIGTGPGGTLLWLAALVVALLVGGVSGGRVFVLEPTDAKRQTISSTPVTPTTVMADGDLG